METEEFDDPIRERLPALSAMASATNLIHWGVSRGTGKPASLRKHGRFHVKRRRSVVASDSNTDSCRYTDSTLHAWWNYF